MADNEALRVSSSGSPPWLVIAGEIDESTYPILLAGLAAAEGYREIHIELGGVRYCDLAGLRSIVRLTGTSSVSGRPIRRVVLHAVPSWLAEVLQILGWDTVPGIALEELPLSGASRLRRWSTSATMAWAMGLWRFCHDEPVAVRIQDHDRPGAVAQGADAR